VVRGSFQKEQQHAEMIEQMETKHAQEIQALKTEQAKAFDTNLNILKKD